jgi:RimJ/RimL family protein N-acetyltransferase
MMGLLDVFHHKEPEGDPLTGGADVPVPVLRGPRVTLRPPATGDADAARRIGVHPEIERLFGEEAADEWRELTSAEADALLASLGPVSGRVSWVVDDGHGFIGSARLHSFDDDARSAAYAVGLLDPAVLGHGLGTEVTRLVLAHAFDDLGLAALTVRVLEFNARAVACYARCGFVLDRREPDAVTFGGVRYDDVLMRLDVDRYRRLAPSWRAVVEPPDLS